MDGVYKENDELRQRLADGAQVCEHMLLQGNDLFHQNEQMGQSLRNIELFEAQVRARILLCFLPSHLHTHTRHGMLTQLVFPSVGPLALPYR